MKCCPQCRKEFDDAVKFCSDCGLPLIETLEQEASELLHEELPEEDFEELPEETVGAVFAVPEQPPETATEAPPLSPREAKRAEKQQEKMQREQNKAEKQRRKEEKAAARRAPIGAPRRILAVFLCLLLFLLLMSASLGAALRAATTGKGLNAVLDEIELGQVRVDPYFEDVDEEMTLSRLLSEDLERVGVSLNEKDVNKLLRKSTLKSFFAGELAALFDDVYKGKSRYEFDRNALATELMDSRNLELFEREDVTLDRPTAEGIARLVDNYGLGDLLSRDELREEQPAVYAALHYGLSYVTLGLLLALSLLLVVLIVRTNRSRIGVSLGDVGGVLIAVGAILSLAAVFAQFFPGLWQKLFVNDALVAQVSAAVLRSQIAIGLVTLGVGVLLAAFGRLLRPRKKKDAPAPEQ